MEKYTIQFEDHKRRETKSISLCAENRTNAILRANIVYNIPYSYIISITKDTDHCTPSHSYDKLDSYNTNEEEEEESITFFDVNWNDYTEVLAGITAPEDWSNDTYPNNGILANYMTHTYKKLKSEKNIICAKNYALFNTGLFTKYYEPIYTYQSGTEISFLTAYELGGIGITERPERANYFEKPELLLLD